MIAEGAEILKTVWGFVRRPVSRKLRRIRVWFFERSNKCTPIDEIDAGRIAYTVLAGNIIRAISFRNLDSRRAYIACVRTSSERDIDSEVFILERVGDAFRVRAHSGQLYLFKPSQLEVCDADKDGYREVVFEDYSGGSGAGTRRLMVYPSRQARLFTISEFRNWQDRAGPKTPVIEFDPEPEAEIRELLEVIAKQRGFLQFPGAVDFDDAEHAVERWHKENGRKREGVVRVHAYAGYPVYGATVIATLETERMTWISFFKGPVMGYDKQNDQHFVAYSSDWSYNWASCLAWDGARLWWGLHAQQGIMSYSPADSLLNVRSSIRGTPLPWVDQIEFDSGTLILNSNLRLPVDSLVSQSADTGKRPN